MTLYSWYVSLLPFFHIRAEIITVVKRVGDKTPADLLLFSATDLKVDNSSLTGESEPQERGHVHKGSAGRPVEAENLVRLLSHCISFHLPGSCQAFNSTLVVNGEAWGGESETVDVIVSVS